MLSKLRPRLTYANVMATAAVFIALGGSSYAVTQLPRNSVGSKQLKRNAVTGAKIKSNAITGRKVRNRSLTGADLRLDTLGQVPNAAEAQHAQSAERAATASDADKLDGIDSTGFLRSTPPEPYHEVGAPGEPGFQNNWTNAGGGLSTAAFFKDPLGVVHLKGVVAGDDSTVVFTLPTGYRPSQILALPARGPGVENAAMTISTNGDLVLACDCVGVNPVGMDGLTFRAE